MNGLFHVFSQLTEGVKIKNQNERWDKGTEN